MLKSLIINFLPWILYFILNGPTQSQIDLSISVAAVASILFEIKSLKKGYLLSWATLFYFVLLCLVVVILRIDLIIKYEWILSNAMLAIIAWISVLIKQPFTIQYAREEVAPEYWQSHLFIKINYILSAVWAVIFTFGIVLNLLHLNIPWFKGPVYEVGTYLPSIFGAWFTGWFPDWYKKRFT